MDFIQELKLSRLEQGLVVGGARKRDASKILPDFWQEQLGSGVGEKGMTMSSVWTG